MSANEALTAAAKILSNAQFIVALTGAGVSKESGVPTFRDAMEGLWAQYDPQELATPTAFRRNPKLVWDWYEYRRGLVRQAKPNAGHVALAALEQRPARFMLITQNVDELHEEAGSVNVLHLHGRIMQTKCFFDCQGDPTLVDVATLTSDSSSTPPPCPHCGRWLRPNVVWFEERLPIATLNAASVVSQLCDVMLVIGTSGIVQPAASLPQVAQQGGATIIEINPEATPLSPLASLTLRGASGVILPQLLAAVAAAEQ
jgi:NAD-dependent deacetylase